MKISIRPLALLLFVPQLYRLLFPFVLYYLIVVNIINRRLYRESVLALFIPWKTAQCSISNRKQYDVLGVLPCIENI